MGLKDNVVIHGTSQAEANSCTQDQSGAEPATFLPASVITKTHKIVMIGSIGTR
jgi:hypothetical protein